MRANRLGEPKPNQAVGALLLCPATGRALLQHRDRNSDSPLTWGTFGGGVDEGEQLKQALKRELQEECAFEGEMELIPLNKFTSDDKTFQYFTYIALVTEEFTPITNHETEGYKWFDVTNRGAYPSPLHPGLEELINSEPHWDRIQECVDANYSVSAQSIKMGSNLPASRGQDFLNDAARQLKKGKNLQDFGTSGDYTMYFVATGEFFRGTMMVTSAGKVIGALAVSPYKNIILSVYLDPRARGKGLGLALYLGAIRGFSTLRSDTDLGIMAVKVWQKLAKYHTVKVLDADTRQAVPYTWSKDGIPIINGQPMNKGMNLQREYVFAVGK